MLLKKELIRRMQSYAASLERLCTIPGVDVLTAWTLIAELGAVRETVGMFPRPPRKSADKRASQSGRRVSAYRPMLFRIALSQLDNSGTRTLRRTGCASAAPCSRETIWAAATRFTTVSTAA